MNFNGKDKPLTNKQYERWCRVMHLFFIVFRCHQLPERSFHINGMQLPLCARCTGLFLSFFIIAPIITIFTLGNINISIILLFLMIADGSLQALTDYRSNNIIRFITGLGAGYGAFTIIVHIILAIIQIFH